MNNEFVIQPIKMPPFMCIDNKPPTLYSLLESIVNYGKTEKTKIKNLAKNGRTKVFDFDYPLSTNIDKATFETNILNHFLTRRIGQETFTAFQIQLNVKLNEIMPIYNNMFDMLSEWNIIDDIETHKSTDNRTINKADNTETNTSTETTNNSETTNNIETSSTTNTETTQDKRFSDLPQNQINNVKDGTYLTQYGFDTNNSESEDTSNSEGTTNTNSEQNVNTEQNTTATQNTIDNNINNATIRKLSPEKYFEYIEKMQSVYTLIYKNLDCLFYQLV